MPTEHLECEGANWMLLDTYVPSSSEWSIELTKVTPDNEFVVGIAVPDDDLGRPCTVSIHTEENIPNAVLLRLLLRVADTSRHAGVEHRRERSSPES
ncbi:hypothetical protein [Actinocorallia populi]|uniref:hypothetical protein n=1 Tax=Actinocorallia populi TaxID=2079200 RepID=UPI000D094A94|nr:hypothetical protein [Actinocorallia populi]